MSHARARKEKDCLNCGAIVQGRYCQECGQENVVPHETFGHMVKHFFYDITHFDSKFFDSVIQLIRKPGFLSKEYNAGRRFRYLHPVKMYVFTSAVFFLIFFSLFSINEPDISVPGEAAPATAEISKLENYAYAKAKTRDDSLAIKKLVDLVGKDSTVEKDSIVQGNIRFTFDNDTRKYKSVHEYDSVQKVLPLNKRDGWFIRMIRRKSIDLNSRYANNENLLYRELGNKFIHTFPYLLFVSLPLYALFLKLLYTRHKKLFFVDHGIFLIHLYIFTFLLMLVFFGMGELSDFTGWGWIGFLQAALVLYGIWYAYKSMRNFYGQRRGKTVLKFILLNILCFISLVILFAGFLAFTFFRV